MDTMTMFRHLTDDERQEFTEYETLFGTPGWERIQTMAEKDLEAATGLAANAQSWDENRIMLGRRLQLNALLGFERAIYAHFENLAQERIDEETEESVADPLEFE